MAGVDPSKWQGLLDQLDASSGGGDVYYLKQPKTRVRLVVPSMAPGEDDSIDEAELNFYAETTKHYQGTARPAFLVFGMILGTSDKADKNVDPNKVRAIRMPKTALRAIVGALAEGHELFDDKVGHAIAIERIGGAGSDRTSYSIQVSPKPVPVSLTALEWPADDLWTIADAETVRSAERDAKKSGEDDRASQRRGRRNVPQDVDDDEDLPF